MIKKVQTSILVKNKMLPNHKTSKNKIKTIDLDN